MSATDFCIEETFKQLTDARDVLEMLQADLEYMSEEVATAITCGGSIYWTEGHMSHLNAILGEWSLNLPAVRAAAVNLRKIHTGD
jgi:hypothetical protein